MNSAILFRQLFDPESSSYTYLLADRKTKQGILIDPVKEQFERDIKLIQELGIKLKYVLDTHVHADHITSTGLFKAKFPALKSVFGAAAEVSCADISIADGDELHFGSYAIKALATPGHTAGCTSFYAEGMVFTGDTLLIRGCGRTDFQQGDAEQLYHSVQQKLYTLDDETLVYPAHNYNGLMVSSIAEEKRFNPRLALDKSQSEFIDIMHNLNLAAPKKIGIAAPANGRCGFSQKLENNKEENFSMTDLHQRIADLPENELVIDVRSKEEFELGRVPGSRNISVEFIADYAEELKNFERLFLVCGSGKRALAAFIVLASKGLNNLILMSGSGLKDWQEQGFELERSI